MSAEAIQGLFIFAIFLWLFTIIFTIVLAKTKGYSGILAFLLGLFIPLLGSTIIIALLPDNKNAKPENKTSNKKSEEPKTYRCNICGNEKISQYTVCPHCESS